MVLNRITFGELPPLVNEMASQSNMWIQTVPPNRREIISTINVLECAGLDDLPAVLFIAAPTVTIDLLLPFIRKFWGSETFSTKRKKGMMIKTPKKGTRCECDNWSGIRVFPGLTKVITKVIKERIKEYLESLINREQVVFRSGSSCIDHIDILRIILKQCSEFIFSLHLLFIDVENSFDSVIRECTWRALRRRGIPEKVIAITRVTYNGAKRDVLHRSKISEHFEVQSEARQACIVSPILFLLVIGDVLHTVQTTCRNSMDDDIFP